jgi:hypothetical protein
MTTIWTLAVHPFDLRRGEPSIHGGCGPGPAYPQVPAMPHRELTHTVQWSPMGAKFGASIFGDTHRVALFGHDSGIGILHASAPIDNLDLPLTILTSTCKWLFASTRVITQGQAIVGFAPYAPYLGCQAPVLRPGTKWLPLQGTVVLPMSAMDLLMGWVRLFAAVGLAAVSNGLFAKCGFKPGAVDGQTAARVGRAVLERLGTRAANEALLGTSVRLVVDWTVVLPYQIGELNLNAGTWTLLVWESQPRNPPPPKLYLQRILEPRIESAPPGPISPALAEMLADVPLLNGEDEDA